MATKYTKKPVEQWLDEIDYKFMGYMPSDEALKFTNFIKEVNGGSEENETPIVHLKMMDSVFNGQKRCAILCHRGIGKRQPLYSKIKTPSGWTTMEEVSVGDEVINRYGKSTVVIYKTPEVTKPVYTIRLSDGSSFDVDEDHNNIVWMYRKKDREKVLTTKELLSRPLFTETANRTSVRDPKRQYTYSIPIVEPVEMPSSVQSNDPYVMGIMLADGHFSTGVLSCHLDDMIETAKELSDRGYTVNYMKPTSQEGGIISTSSVPFKEYKDCVFEKKYIPDEYMNASITQRLLLLQGLMDGDGSLTSNGGSKFFTSNPNLAEQVVELTRGLGAIAYIKNYDRPDKGNGKTEYVVVINIKLNPFKLGRKAKLWKPTKKTSRAITSIGLVGDHPGHCIAVESEDHSYVTDNYTITHNTTLFAEYLILFIAAFGYFPGFGKTNLILYVTDSIENGVKNLRRNVEFRYANSEFLQKLIPNRKITVGTDGAGFVDPDEYESQAAGGRKFTDIRLEFMNNKGHTTIIKGYGAKTGVRGAKEMGQRPTVAILDDLVSDTDAESATIIKTIGNTVYKAVSKALSPVKQKMVWLGTPFNARDPLYKAVESGAWMVSVYPICERFPVNKEDFRGSWDDRFTYEYVKDEYDEATALAMPENFNQELMLRIMSEEDRLINDKDIKWFYKESVMKNKGNYNFYITTDFATSERESSDFSVISVWAYNNNGDWMYIDGIVKRQLMDQNINDLFRFASKYKPLGVGVEVSGQQKGFISWIRKEMVAKNIFFNLSSDKNSSEEGIRPTTNKMARFHVVLPLFKAGKIWFPEELRESIEIKEAIDELKNISVSGMKSAHDDFIDTISMLGVMQPFEPSIQSTYKEDKLNSSIWRDEYDDDDDYKSSTIF